MSKNCKH